MPKRIPEEEQQQQRAIRLVSDHLDEYPNITAACETISKRLGLGLSRCAGGCVRRRSTRVPGRGG